MTNQSSVLVTDTEVQITARNGVTWKISLDTGEPIGAAKVAKATKTARKAPVPREDPAKLTEVKVSPRCILRVGDEVEFQLKKGARKLRSQIRDIREERGAYYVGVRNPTTGNLHTISVDMVTRPRNKALSPGTASG